PPRASTGSGHQVGVDENPSPLGRSLYIQSCSSVLSLRNQYATADRGTPSIAVRMSRPRYRRLLRTASGSGAVIARYLLPPAGPPRCPADPARPPRTGRAGAHGSTARNWSSVGASGAGGITPDA